MKNFKDPTLIDRRQFTSPGDDRVHNPLQRLAWVEGAPKFIIGEEMARTIGNDINAFHKLCQDFKTNPQYRAGIMDAGAKNIDKKHAKKFKIKGITK
jgi:hypothetical protein